MWFKDYTTPEITKGGIPPTKNVISVIESCRRTVNDLHDEALTLNVGILCKFEHVKWH